jgi:arylsulfatase A-like enzyme
MRTQALALALLMALIVMAGGSAIPDARAQELTTVPRSSVAETALPNVLLISIDSLRADRLGSYGNLNARTPTLDRLANEGVRFARTYSPRNNTTPAHATIFSGAYPSTHGLWRLNLDWVLNLESGGDGLIRPGVATLAEVLASRGYATAALFNFWSFQPLYSGLDRGFQSYGMVTGSQAAPADVTTDHALRWLDGYTAARLPGSRPFFLWVHYEDPHFPYTPPSPFDQVTAVPCPECLEASLLWLERIHRGESLTESESELLQRFYDAEIAFVDHELARLLAHLEHSGLDQETLIVVTADHGEGFGEYGTWLHAQDLSDPELHVPWIMRFPEMLPAGRTVQMVSSLADVMPTMLDILGLPLPATVDGQSLLPIVLQGERRDDGYVIAETADRSHTTIITRDWQLIRDNDNRYLRLYPIRAGKAVPDERAALEPTVVAELERHIDQWLASHPDPTVRP